MASPNGDEPGGPVGDLSYTEASRELDEIVAFFEQREVDIDQLVSRLERATAIVDELDRRLRRTRLQVEELVPRLSAAIDPDRLEARPDVPPVPRSGRGGQGEAYDDAGSVRAELTEMESEDLTDPPDTEADVDEDWFEDAGDGVEEPPGLF